MTTGITAFVYPVKDLAKAKELYQQLLGVPPYADAPYYVGFKVGGIDIGLDPNGHQNGSTPIAYWQVTDIHETLQQLVAAGAQIQQEPKDVGGGMLVALALDADGNVIGLRQAPQ